MLRLFESAPLHGFNVERKKEIDFCATHLMFEENSRQAVEQQEVEVGR